MKEAALLLAIIAIIVTAMSCTGDATPGDLWRAFVGG